MKKQINLIVLLMMLIFGIINYGLYNFYFKDKFGELNKQKQSYDEITTKIKNINKYQAELKRLQEHNEKLKRDTEPLDKIVAKYIDTPQLAYDFYTSCLQYKVNGEEIKFQLANKEPVANEGNKVSDSNADMKVNSKLDSKKTGDILEKNIEINNNNTLKGENKDFQKLTVELKVSGSKSNIEEYLRNLNNITKRQLNIKSVAVNSENINLDNVLNDEKNKDDKDTAKSDSGQKNNIEKSNTEKNTENKKNSSSIKNPDDLIAEIVFYQYVEPENQKKFDNNKEYDFYDKNIGFDSIGNMFKK